MSATSQHVQYIILPIWEKDKSGTRRGAVEPKVRADSAVPPGVVFIPFCYGEAAANLLTNPQLDSFGNIPEFKYCAARVEAVAARAAAAE